MEIQTIQKEFEAFECKFEPFERDLKCWNANSNHWKLIASIRMEIWTIWKEFEVLECKFDRLEIDYKH